MPMIASNGPYAKPITQPPTRVAIDCMIDPSVVPKRPWIRCGRSARSEVTAPVELRSSSNHSISCRLTAANSRERSFALRPHPAREKLAICMNMQIAARMAVMK